MLTDEDLLDFNASTLALGESGAAQRLLDEHGDIYRAQLVAALWLEDAAKERETSNANVPWPRRTNSDHDVGFAAATKEIIAQLRQGDFLPGGEPFENIHGRRY